MLFYICHANAILLSFLPLSQPAPHRTNLGRPSWIESSLRGLPMHEDIPQTPRLNPRSLPHHQGHLWQPCGLVEGQIARADRVFDSRAYRLSHPWTPPAPSSRKNKLDNHMGFPLDGNQPSAPRLLKRMSGRQADGAATQNRAEDGGPPLLQMSYRGWPPPCE